MKTNISVLVVTIFLAACAGPRAAQQPALAEIAGAEDFSTISGDWVLQALDGQTWSGQPGATMNLSADGRFAGSGGCNRYFGAFTFTEGKLAAGPIASTMMACEEAAMDLERRYLGLLEKVARITHGDARLHLLDEQGRELLALRAAGPVD